ncbi:MAG: hypothetical protein JWM53_5652 [bacterium]|nr:hypothetical protein [bacterium]
MTRVLAVACLVAAIGCDPLAAEFVCSGSSACRHAGTQGTCEADHHCSFPDTTCPSMKRYSDYAGRLSAACVGSDIIALPTGVLLPATWYGQETQYWAGPAAARIAMSTRTSNPPSQQTLATFLGTTPAGTDNIGLVKNALNHYLATTWFETKTISDPATQPERDLLRRDVLFNLNNGYPLVADVVSGFRPPGYPPGPALIYTYVAIVGYDSNGDRVLVADPGAEGFGGAGWQGVARTYWISLADLGTWIAGKGYTA